MSRRSDSRGDCPAVTLDGAVKSASPALIGSSPNKLRDSCKGGVYKLMGEIDRGVTTNGYDVGVAYRLSPAGNGTCARAVTGGWLCKLRVSKSGGA